FDTHLLGLLGKPWAQAQNYLGPPDNWNRDTTQIAKNYMQRGLSLDTDPANGDVVNDICFIQPGYNGFSGSSGDPIKGVAPGMTKPALEARVGLPVAGGTTSNGLAYTTYNVAELGGKVVDVYWSKETAKVDQVAQLICVNK